MSAFPHPTLCCRTVGSIQRALAIAENSARTGEGRRGPRGPSLLMRRKAFVAGVNSTMQPLVPLMLVLIRRYV